VSKPIPRRHKDKESLKNYIVQHSIEDENTIKSQFYEYQFIKTFRVLRECFAYFAIKKIFAYFVFFAYLSFAYFNYLEYLLVEACTS